jgi:hypothetical protein
LLILGTADVPSLYISKNRVLAFSLATPLTAPLRATNRRVPTYIQLMK